LIFKDGQVSGRARVSWDHIEKQVLRGGLLGQSGLKVICMSETVAYVSYIQFRRL